MLFNLINASNKSIEESLIDDKFRRIQPKRVQLIDMSEKITNDRSIVNELGKYYLIHDWYEYIKLKSIRIYSKNIENKEYWFCGQYSYIAYL